MNQRKKEIIHIFNSKYILDKKRLQIYQLAFLVISIHKNFLVF